MIQFQCMQQRRQAPPTLPPPPPNLSPQQLKRRHIVAAIVHSENSYVSTLQRLVNVRVYREQSRLASSVKDGASIFLSHGLYFYFRTIKNHWRNLRHLY